MGILLGFVGAILGAFAPGPNASHDTRAFTAILGGLTGVVLGAWIDQRACRDGSIRTDPLMQ